MEQVDFNKKKKKMKRKKEKEKRKKKHWLDFQVLPEWFSSELNFQPLIVSIFSHEINMHPRKNKKRCFNRKRMVCIGPSYDYNWFYLKIKSWNICLM